MCATCCALAQYTVLVVMILANFLVAIILDAFGEVKEDQARWGPDWAALGRTVPGCAT